MELKLKREALLRRQNLIGGEWTDAVNHACFPVVNPATGAVIAHVANSGPADARAATDAAAKAASDWRARLPRERAEILRRWHASILDNAEDLAALMSAEQGKPLPEARNEVAYGASYVAWFAEEGTRLYGDLIPQQQRGKQMRAVKEPIGIVAAITPWNFPMAMITRKIAPALAVGCTVVAKPAEDTPLTALALVGLAHDAGVPAGVLNLLSASREQGIEVVGDWLADERVRKVTFTGSTAVGKHLARESAQTLKKLSLELGGNAPFIVFDDADVEAAVAGLLAAKFRNGGQTCVCPNRIYVQSGVFDAFARTLAAHVGELHVAPATDPGAQIGPMINAKAVDKIERHVRDALVKGATVLVGGRRLAEKGPNYYAPTVIANATSDMLVTSEETFGPVAPLYRFTSEDEVIRLANDTPYGLAAYVYTRDHRRAERVCGALEVGVIGLNEGSVASEAAPFGGVKASGYGREGSRYGLDDYLSIKYICQGGLD
ncbi:NAD-dependent succinate-semialdehyde dehydrogenase [Pandoraea sp. ISTKB]|uniref:NAD-dependent succinate-semialdehyde dehydrogenase n=1 Tax=Pandoraea sp. ISTKB TaxID=1586708 RepID=UPI000847974E|nr:NAD-dependent succinate-semialdehyde dehydrogenase [Pandoraea sp. ISTKB]ODP34690.1 succinate-semialdehyde dehydrogenase (NADP(+)) [Pandoraea sp. ISTKB]